MRIFQPNGHVAVFLTIIVLLFSPSAAHAQSCSATVINNIGDNITVTVTYSSTDPNENGEGEPLLLSSSGGDFSATITAYLVPQTFSYTATQVDETITGAEPGYDGDETCLILASANQPHFLSVADKQKFARFSTQTSKEANAAKASAGALMLTGDGAPLGVIIDAAMVPVFQIESGVSGLIAKDPIDRSYTIRALPIIPSVRPLAEQKGIPPAVTFALNRFRENGEEIIGFEKALYTSLNRAAGAYAAGATFFVNVQTEDAKIYEEQLGILFNREARLLSELQDVLQANGITVTVTPAEVLSFETQVAATGLPADDIKALQQLGADASLITYITQLAIVQDANAAAGNFPQLLTSSELISSLTSFSAGPPTKKDDCRRDDQWQDYNIPRRFQDLDDCMRFIDTGK